MTLHCSVNYNEAYMLVLNNGCLGIGLGDCDMNYGWLEVVGLTAPDITIGEYLEFDYKGEDHKHYHCKKIRAGGRFMGYRDPEIFLKQDSHKVWAPVEFNSATYGLKATNFETQLQWLEDNHIWNWSFYPAQELNDNQIKLVWMFADPDDAMLFKLTWA